MRKTLLAAALACSLALAAAQTVDAQTAEAGPLISFEHGYQVGYSLASSDIGSALDFALGFALTDELEAQVSFVQGDAIFDSYRLLGLSYALGPKIGASMLVGKGTASGNVAGIGFHAILLSRQVSGSLRTSLKLRAGYIAPMSNYANGVLAFGLAAALGI